MVNIIKAELYKNLRRSIFYIISALIAFIFISLPIIYKLICSELSLDEIHSILSLFNSFLPLFTLFPILFAFILSEEYTEKTLKNVMPCNISKFKFLASKFIVQAIFLLFIYLLVIGCFIISLSICANSDISAFSLALDSAKRVIFAAPIYLSCMAFIDLLIIIFRNETIVYLLYIIFFSQLPSTVGSLLATVMPKWFTAIQKYVFMMGLIPIANQPILKDDLIFAAFSGTAYTIAIFLISYIIYSKQDIK